MREALAVHLPLLARTANDMEELFVEICEIYDLHSTRAQMYRDRERDLTLLHTAIASFATYGTRSRGSRSGSRSISSASWAWCPSGHEAKGEPPERRFETR